MRVRVAHAALNPGGLYFVSVIPASARARTCVPEVECAGVVEETWTPPEQSTTITEEARVEAEAEFAPGDRVAVLLPTPVSAAGVGALATHVVVPAALAARVPDAVSSRDAAALLLTGLTAKRMVADAGVAPREGGCKVLIVGASGGVGTMAVQLARRAAGPGGRIVAVCSGGNADLVRRLGADEV